MKKLFGFLLLAAAMLVSCEQQELPSSSGKAVRFTTSVGTKTSFAGVTQNGVEGLLWENGDTFTVSSEQASVAGSSQKWANYQVKAESGVAIAVNPAAEGVELLWGQGLHQFYAAYPQGTLSGNVVTATIPDYQVVKETGTNVFVPDISKFGVMYASAQAKPEDGSVNLAFNPLFSTFEFTVSPGNEKDALVSAFRLEVQNGSKVVLAGNFKAALYPDADPRVEPDYTNATGIVKLQFGDHRSIKVPKGTTLTFSVVTYAVPLSHLTAVFTVDGKEVALPLADKDGKYYSFPAGEKARIRALGALGPEALAAGITVVLNGQNVNDFDISTPGEAGVVGLLPGVFKVGDKKVRFAKGNLQAVLDNGTITKWQFAENQWDLATNAWELPSETGTVDGFQVSTTAPKNRWGTHYYGYLNFPPDLDPAMNSVNAELNPALTQFFNEYHVGPIVHQWDNPDFVNEYGSGWTLLDAQELQSLFFEYAETTYPPHTGGWDWYKPHFTTAKVEGVDGLVLLPDDFQQPEGITVKLIDELLTDAVMGAFSFTGTLNKYSAQDWAQMEAAGAVFFPASNYMHYTSSVTEVAYDPSVPFYAGVQGLSGFNTIIESALYGASASPATAGKIRLVYVLE